MKKRRLDTYLVEEGLVESRQKARGLILAGEVVVDDQRRDKPGFFVSEGAEVRLKSRPRYVSRGALKLESVAKEFGFPIKDLIFMDIGASTGGFTDFLLQHGANQVLTVDVGTNQLHYSLRQDQRVTTLEQTHILELEELPLSPQGIVMDLSFISLTRVLPGVNHLIQNPHFIICLVKPQFEVGKQLVGKKGVVRNQKAVIDALEKVKDCAFKLGYSLLNAKASKVLGPKGNQEFFFYLSNEGKIEQEETDLKAVVENSSLK